MKTGHLASILITATCTALAAAAGEPAEGGQKVQVQLGQSGRAQQQSFEVSAHGNQRQQSPEPAMEPGMSELTMTVYGGTGRGFGPVLNRRGIAVGLDVTTEMETCPDGNTRINALVIGTWRYKMDGGCDDFRRGGHISVSLNGSNTMITTRSDLKKSADDSTQVRCDASTWTCRAE